MTQAQRSICEAYVREHWDDDVSTEHLLETAAQYVRQVTPGQPFDCGDVAEVIHDMPDETDKNTAG